MHSCPFVVNASLPHPARSNQWSASLRYSFASSRVSCKFRHVLPSCTVICVCLSVWSTSGLSTPVPCWIGFCGGLDRGHFTVCVPSPDHSLLGFFSGSFHCFRNKAAGDKCVHIWSWLLIKGINTFSHGKYLLRRLAEPYGNCSAQLDKNLTNCGCFPRPLQQDIFAFTFSHAAVWSGHLVSTLIYISLVTNDVFSEACLFLTFSLVRCLFTSFLKLICIGE